MKIKRCQTVLLVVYILEDNVWPEVFISSNFLQGSMFKHVVRLISGIRASLVDVTDSQMKLGNSDTLGPVNIFTSFSSVAFFSLHHSSLFSFLTFLSPSLPFYSCSLFLSPFSLSLSLLFSLHSLSSSLPLSLLSHSFSYSLLSSLSFSPSSFTNTLSFPTLAFIYFFFTSTSTSL